MGRKIPGKKHRGVKDPAVQQETRHAKVKNLINAPPKDPEAQHIPKSLQRIIDFKQKLQDGAISLKRKRKKKKKLGLISTVPKGPVKQRKGKPEKAIPVFEQRPGEPGKKFLNRVHNIVQNYLKENEFEQTYKVDVVRNAQTGEIEGVKKKEKDEIEDLMRKKQKEARIDQENKEKGIKKKKKKKKVVPKLTKAEKRKKRIEAKKQLKQGVDIDGFSKYKDNVKFGEIVHCPPTLELPKKNKKIIK